MEVPYEAMVRALPGFLAHITVEGRLLFLNRLAPGFTAADIANATIFDFTRAEDREVARASIARAVATKSATAYPSMAAGAPGELVPYYTMIAPILDGDRVTSCVLYATDVSHLVEAHQALAASEAKLRLALEATGLGIWHYDRARGEVAWDATVSAIHGYPAEPRIEPSDSSSKHVHPEDHERVLRESMKGIAAAGCYGPIEHRIVRLDGSVGWVSATGTATGSVVVGGVIDITARKQAEERVARAERLDSIGRLAGGVAHDFNNMLTAILGYADLCLAAVSPGTPIAEDLLEIKRAGERSRELTSRLLMFARKQRGQPRVVDPNIVVLHLERLLQRIVGEDIALVSVRRATRNVRVDLHQIEQLLINLVTNARDAMPRGGRLSIDTEDAEIPTGDDEVRAGPCVRIRVTDTGIGIPAELLPYIFEPFVTSKAPHLGTGLGLAQCYGIARHHGGRLRISSWPGRTEVSLDLPAVDEPALRDEVSHHAPAGGHETLLLVEDEDPIRTLVARLLRDHGYQVLEAPSAEVALELASRHTGALDLVITDMVMTGRNGLELAADLRRTRPAIAVLVMSGYSPQLAHIDARVSFLQKPFSPEELLEKVRVVLAARAAAAPS